MVKTPKKPRLLEASIPAGSIRRSETITLNKARTVSATVRLTFAVGSATGTFVQAIYSPDGVHWDTEPLMGMTITSDPGKTNQYTMVFTPPEHGYLTFRVYNIDPGNAITDVHLWWSIQNWEDKI